MQTVQLIRISFWYMVFTANNHYYLLDRKPVNILGYFFPYINWLFKQKIYLISKQEFDQLLYQEQCESDFTLSNSIIWLGAIVNSFVTRSKLMERFTTNLSISNILLFFCFLFIVAFCLIIKIYNISKSNMNSQINLDSKEFHYYKLRLQKITVASIKLFLMHIFLWFVMVFITFMSMSSRNVLFFVGALLIYSIALFFGVDSNQHDVLYYFYPEQDSPNQQKNASEDLF